MPLREIGSSDDARPYDATIAALLNKDRDRIVIARTLIAARYIQG